MNVIFLMLYSLYFIKFIGDNNLKNWGMQLDALNQLNKFKYNRQANGKCFLWKRRFVKNTNLFLIKTK